MRKSVNYGETPWGSADGHRWLFVGGEGESVEWFTTPSHGGFKVSDAARAKWPVALRDFRPFAGNGWYEEDCDWAIVAMAMPHLFSDEDKQRAEWTIRSTASWSGGGQRWTAVRDWIEARQPELVGAEHV
jgi:hypothetical protein